jgi:hypothetical protein
MMIGALANLANFALDRVRAAYEVAGSKGIS